MPRRALLFPILAAFAIGAFTLVASSTPALAVLVGVAEVSASKPSFGPNETVNITVRATDDDGTLRISSSLPGSKLVVVSCSGIGGNQVAAKCDSGGLSAVSGQNSRDIFIDTAALDSDATPEEALVVTLKLTAPCESATAVTIDADQPQNAGPDAVTINCIPSTPTPTPTLTPTATNTPTFTPTATGTPPATSTPPAATPTSTPITEVLSSGIKPPSTGDAGLK